MQTTRMHNELSRPGLSIFRVITMIVIGVGMFVLGAMASWGLTRSSNTLQLISPLVSDEKAVPPNPYAQFRFSELAKLQLSPGPVRIENLIDAQPSYASFLVSWDVPDLETGTRVKVTGQMNLPQGDGPFPVIVMLRGYADREIYSTGLGTRNAAAAFARNGYITIAPDFPGFGGSGPESNDILVARFSKPVTVLQLLQNLENLQVEASSSATTAAADAAAPITFPTNIQTLFQTDAVGIWAHSNGGQIALSTLEITNRVLPTTLWAPVSQPFPYSVLYYSNETPDGGKYLRRELANFEFTLDNDPQDFSVLSQPERIIAPVQIHQGGADDAVPFAWSNMLYDELLEATIEAELFTYPSADHNLQPNWDEAVQRDLIFFAEHLK